MIMLLPHTCQMDLASAESWDATMVDYLGSTFTIFMTLEDKVCLQTPVSIHINSH